MAPPTVSLQYFVELSSRGSVWSLSWSARDVCTGLGEGSSVEEDEVKSMMPSLFLQLQMTSFVSDQVGSIGGSLRRWFVLDSHAAQE